MSRVTRRSLFLGVRSADLRWRGAPGRRHCSRPSRGCCTAPTASASVLALGRTRPNLPLYAPCGQVQGRPACSVLTAACGCGNPWRTRPASRYLGAGASSLGIVSRLCAGHCLGTCRHGRAESIGLSGSRCTRHQCPQGRVSRQGHTLPSLLSSLPCLDCNKHACRRVATVVFCGG